MKSIKTDKLKKLAFPLSIVALIFGLMMFSTSLIMASQDNMALQKRSSEKKLYVGRILPDHIFYPILMVMDRAVLSLSFGESSIHNKLTLSRDRLKSAQLLLDKHEEELALSTITKAQKYVLSAAHEVIENKNTSAEARDAVKKALSVTKDNLPKLKEKFLEQDTSAIDKLVAETEILLSQI